MERSTRQSAIGLADFRRQQIIGRYIVDFFCEAADLAVELDSAGHLESIEEDRLRDTELAKQGIKVMRSANQEFREHQQRNPGRNRIYCPRKDRAK